MFPIKGRVIVQDLNATVMAVAAKILRRNSDRSANPECLFVMHPYVRLCNWSAGPPSTLALLVARIGADDVDAALSAHDFAVLTDAFNASAYLHRYSLSVCWLKPTSIAVLPSLNKGQFQGKCRRNATGPNDAEVVDWIR